MRITILILMMLTLIGCKAQDSTKQNNMGIFDIDKFSKNKNHINEYEFQLDDGTIIKQRKDSDEYYETIQKMSSYFYTINRYYFNGSLKASVEYFPSHFFQGIYREYDEQGKLVKETDYNKGFEYSWEDLLQLLKKRKVNIRDTDNTTITKENGNWRFDYIDGIHIFDVIIDGKTGVVLQDAKNIFEEGS